MTENIDSSVKFGVRPKISFIRSNSSGRTPRSLAVSSVVSCRFSNISGFLMGCPKVGKTGGIGKLYVVRFTLNVLRCT